MDNGSAQGSASGTAQLRDLNRSTEPRVGSSNLSGRARTGNISDPFAGLTGTARRRVVKRARTRIVAGRMAQAARDVVAAHRIGGVA